MLTKNSERGGRSRIRNHNARPGIDAFLPDFLARVAKDQVIITYCSGFGCPDSFDLGVLLIELGYQDVRVFEGGYPEWRDAGLPVAGENR